MSAVDPGGCSSAPSTRDCELIMSVSAESAPSCSSSLLGCQESSLSRKAIQVLRAASHPALRAAAGPWLGSSLTTRTGIGWSRPAAVARLLRCSFFESSSTMITSSTATVWAATLHRARSIVSALLKNGITTDTERSEEHTSELQSRGHVVCRLLLEKKNNHGMSTY